METDADLKQYLTFHIGAEEYAITILRVREIIEFSTLTRVPAMPPCVRGVLNLRGTVLPVVDLAVQFGIVERDVTKQTCVVVVDIEFDGQLTTMGIIADGVNQVIEVSVAQIEPPPAFGCKVAEYLTGFVRTQDGFVMMLDVDRALSVDTLMLEQLDAEVPLEVQDETPPTAEAQTC